jgi:FkbM family methyltransferase
MIATINKYAIKLIKGIRFRLHNFCNKCILLLVKIAKVDLIVFAYENCGIGKSYGFEASGEDYFVVEKLKYLIPSGNEQIFFDVGANIGDYSKLLSTNFPSSTIHTFEPNPNTYKLLCKNLPKNIITINKALGDETKSEKLYTLKNNTTSVRSTSDERIIKAMEPTEEVVSFDIKIETLDNYCVENKIDKIDFLKIDAEGYELEVLRGGKNLLKQSKIGVIQFEFNEVNTIKRIFLRDFFDLLAKQYLLYRLDTKKLIPLGNYSIKHEIFIFQNIIAINKSIDNLP